MSPKIWIVCGALSAAMAVACGAMGAHVIPARLESSGMSPAEIEGQLVIFEKAVRYQMIHGLGLLILGALAARRAGGWITLSGCCFLLGIALFSGLLYARVFGGRELLTPLVPVGGTAFIVGWLVLAIGALRMPSVSAAGRQTGES